MSSHLLIQIMTHMNIFLPNIVFALFFFQNYRIDFFQNIFYQKLFSSSILDKDIFLDTQTINYVLYFFHERDDVSRTHHEHRSNTNPSLRRNESDDRKKGLVLDELT